MLGFGPPSPEKLINAARDGKLAKVEKLLAKGADINGKDEKYHQTPLMWAIEYGQENIAHLLIEKGASLDENDGYGNNTALMWVFRGRLSGTAKMNIARLLIEKGADICLKDSDGSSAFIIASLNGYTEALPLLIEKGAKLDEKNNNGRTAFFEAACYGRTGTMAFLIEKGADIHARDNNGSTALWAACCNNKEEAALLLIQKGADVNIADKKNYTLLMYAIKNRFSNIAHLLLDHDANVETMNIGGDTALSLARNQGLGDLASRIKSIIESKQQKEKTESLRQEQEAQTASEKWIKMGDSAIAFVGVYPELQKKITEIFNFKSRERTLISENLALKTETMTQPISFDSTEEKLLREAFTAFTRAKGKADEAYVFKYTRLLK